MEQDVLQILGTNSVSGRVFEDIDRNGIDTDEDGALATRVFLVDLDTIGTSAVRVYVTLTEADGRYAF